VEEILGQRVFGGASCDVRVEVSMRQLEHGGWEADLGFSKSDGQALGNRSLQSRDRSCAALKGPASLVIALMVEASEADATFQVPAAKPHASSSSDALSVSFDIASGLLPDVTYGATAAFGTELARWLPLQLSATFWFPKSHVESDLGGQFWAWQAGAGYCPTLLEANGLSGGVCVGVQAGAIHGTGVGFEFSGAPTKPYGDVEAMAHAEIRLFGSLHAQIGLGLAIPWLRPRFVYFDDTDSTVEVHRPSAVVFLGNLGLAFRAAQPREAEGAPQ
jgi:hypothetical protein